MLGAPSQIFTERDVVLPTMQETETTNFAKVKRASVVKQVVIGDVHCPACGISTSEEGCDANRVVLCDSCDSEYHMDCLKPP